MTTFNKLNSELFQSRFSRGWKSLGIVAIFICTFAHLPICTFAQNVGISATGINPDNSAMLDVTSTTKGMLIPRMTGTEKYTIPSPATGLLIFQTDTIGFWYYDGTKWIPLVSSTSSTASPSNAGWLTTGNIGTAWNKNFLGTTDNVSLRMRTNDTTRMIVDSLGRVGIGTASPTAKLFVADANSAGSGVTSSSLYNYQVRTESNITAATTARAGSNLLLYRMTEGTPGTQGIGEGCTNVAYTDGTNTFYQLRGANNMAYTTSTAAANQNALYGAVNSGYLNSSGTLNNAYGAYNQAYNNSSGTITKAIGAQNYAFTQVGATGTIANAYGSNNIVQNLSTSGGSITQAIGVQSSIFKAATASAIGTGYLYYGTYGSSDAATKHYGLYITGEDTNYFSGKVGIGTATPGAKLDVGDLSTSLLKSVLARASEGNATGEGTYLGVKTYDTQPTNVKSFAIEHKFYGDLNSAINFYRGGSNTGGFIRFATGNGAEQVTIDGAGNVGIGITPTQKLHVAGNGLFTGTVTASCGLLVCSDLRYKKDITLLSHALDKVLSMQGVNYHWKTKEFPEKQFTEVQQIGFIAQELEKIIPEVVMTDKDGYKSVDYSRLTPVLVEAIKEQQKTIGSMQLTIDSQQKTINNSVLETAELKVLVNKLLQQSTTAEAKK